MRLLVVAALVAGSSLTGCTQQSQCVDYGFYDDPASMAEVADLVVVGTQSPTGEHIDHGNAHVAVYEITITDVLKGDPGASTIEAIAPPGGCYDSGVTLDGGILDVDGEAEFFLADVEGTWVTITPDQGVEPVNPGGALPWDPGSTGE